MTEVIGELVSALEAAGVRVMQADAPSHRTVSSCDEWQRPFGPDISFVDDVAILIVAAADELARAVATAVAIACSVAQRYGVELNFAPGKSEALCAFAGKHARAARRDLFIEMRGRIPFEGAGGAAGSLIACAIYKCLGAAVDAKGRMEAEVAHRTRAMTGALCRNSLPGAPPGLLQGAG